MNTKLFLCVFLIIGINAKAQMQKGTVSLEGSVSFESRKYNNLQFFNDVGYVGMAETTTTSFSIAPKIGVFTSSSFLVGLGVNYNHMKIDRDNYDPTDRNEFLITPYIRKYIGLVDNLYFTTTFNAGVGFGSITNLNFSGEESDIFMIRANLSPGLTYFISDKFSATANIGSLYYNYEKIEPNGDSDYVVEGKAYEDSSFGLSMSLSTVSIGIQYLISKKSAQ